MNTHHSPKVATSGTTNRTTNRAASRAATGAAISIAALLLTLAATPASASTTSSTTSNSASAASTTASTTVRATTHTAVASDPEPLVVKTPWSDDLYLVNDPHAQLLTFTQWRKLGFKYPLTVSTIPGTMYYRQAGLSPVHAVLSGKTHELDGLEYARAMSPLTETLPTDIVKYRDSDEIYAVSFTGTNREHWVWHHLTGAEWAALGHPAPRTAGWIKGSIYRWNTNQPGSIWREFNGKATWVSFADWVAAGSPTPTGSGTYPVTATQ